VQGIDSRQRDSDHRAGDPHFVHQDAGPNRQRDQRQRERAQDQLGQQVTKTRQRQLGEQGCLAWRRVR
jgi:hypothetical protein